MNFIHPKYRPDIDGLRALAVLAVVAYHASPLQIKGGFIGVDVFFVISGFLISTIIFQNLEQGRFRFSEFYSRRIRRIFPALLLVLFCCLLAGWVSLYTDEYTQLGKHIVAGCSFIANFLLWQESGYFDSLAETKPLLHLWSLGIEEQFYIFCPFALWCLWQWRIPAFLPILGAAILSFGLNVYLLHTDAVGAFYSPQTRVWELLIGVLLAWHTLYGNNKNKTSQFNNLLSLSGVFLLVLGFIFISKTRLFPGAWALLPTCAAALIIASGPNAWFNRAVLAHRLMVGVGLISFPLYLWHWPILSFLHLIYQGDPSRTARLLAVSLAMALAWLTYRFIEKPIRFSKQKRLKPLISAALVVLVLGFSIVQSSGYSLRMNPTVKHNSWQAKKQVIAGYERSAIYQHATPIKGRDFFLTGNQPEDAQVAIIGDSHANRLYWALAAYKELPLINIGRGTCPPLLDVEVYQHNGDPIHCQPLTNNYLNYLRENPQIKLIVINAFYIQYQRDFILKKGQQAIDLQKALEQTLSYFAKTNKKIMVALDTPEVPQTCYQRHFPVWSAHEKAQCTIAKEDFYAQNLAVLKAVQKYPQVVLFNPESVFCTQQCGEIEPQKYLYLRDGNHLNDYGLAKISIPMHELVQRQLL